MGDGYDYEDRIHPYVNPTTGKEVIMQVIIVGKEEIERLQYGFTIEKSGVVLIPDVELTEEANEKLWEGGETLENLNQSGVKARR